MKLKSFFACFFIVAAFTFANAQENASVLMKQAYAQASKENKKVFVMFHASWCGWCKKWTQTWRMRHVQNPLLIIM